MQAAKLVVKSSIRERVTELKEAQCKKCEMTRDQLREFLVSVILAKPEDANFNNPLCEITMSKAGPAVVFPNKLGAAAQLAKLTGWNEVEKVSVEAGDTLSAFLRQIVTGCDPVLSRKGTRRLCEYQSKRKALEEFERFAE